MTRATNALLVLALLAVAALGAGCSSKGPEDVFNKFKDAAKAQDYGKMYDCMSINGQYGMVAAAVLLLDFSKSDPGAKECKAIFDKYKVKEILEDKSLPQSIDERMPIIAGKISNKRAFVAEAFAALAKESKLVAHNDFAKQYADATLADVKINGDIATGTVSTGKGEKMTMEFRKDGSSWLINTFGG